MPIVVCGLSHRTVPIEVLERVAVPSSELPKALLRLLDHDAVHEGVILSTCNRTEVYVAAHRFHGAVEAVRRFLSDVSGVSQDAVSSGLYAYHGADAAAHLFRVASGIDSMVVGEPEILGQVRAAYRAAQDESTARRLLGPLFQRALRVGKRARAQTQISRHVVSLPQAAARLAAEVAGGLDGRRVLVVGAGRTGELAARAVREAGCTDIVIANRGRERASRLAGAVDGRAVAFADVPRELGFADVVVTTTGSATVVLDADTIERAARGRGLVIVDLAVPRDVDPAAARLPGVRLAGIDDLRAFVEQGSARRRAEIPAVEAIVDEEVSAYHTWERTLGLGPVMEGMRAWAERVRRDEVDRMAGSGVSGAELARLDRATRSVVAGLLHGTMTRARELVAGPDGAVYLEAFRELFATEDD